MNLQPVLDEMKQGRWDPHAPHPELKKFYKENGEDKANAAMTKHWREVDRGITTEFKWTGE